MFLLTDEDLNKTILGAGDGPASFNAEMAQLGYRVVSVDPVYCFSGEQIKHQFYQVVENIIDQVRASPGDWCWSYHQSADQLRDRRIEVMQQFLADYDSGKAQRRYITGSLPQLEFATRSFGLALCSHLLFLYSDKLDYQFHRAAVKELLRVADEVRIFPLLDLNGKPSPYVKQLLEDLSEAECSMEIVNVEYELLRGGNQMLRITSPSGIRP